MECVHLAFPSVSNMGWSNEALDLSGIAFDVLTILRRYAWLWKRISKYLPNDICNVSCCMATVLETSWHFEHQENISICLWNWPSWFNFTVTVPNEWTYLQLSSKKIQKLQWKQELWSESSKTSHGYLPSNVTQYRQFAQKTHLRCEAIFLQKLTQFNIILAIKM